MPRSLQNLKPWQPGQSGNPSGRGGTLPPDIRKLRKANQAELIELVNRLLQMTDAEAIEAVASPDATQLHHATQAVVGRARGGDVKAFSYLMELAAGRIPENDYDGFSEEDLRMLNRVKELLLERRGTEQPPVVGSGH